MGLGETRDVVVSTFIVAAAAVIGLEWWNRRQQLSRILAALESLQEALAGARSPEGTAAVPALTRQENSGPALRLIQEIPLVFPVPAPNDGLPYHAYPQGRLDHFGCDPATKQLFVSCLGDSSLAVIDVYGGRVSQRVPIEGGTPQGVVSTSEGVFVATASGKIHVFQRGTDWPFALSKPVDAKCPFTFEGCEFSEGLEADNIRHVPSLIDGRCGSFFVAMVKGNHSCICRFRDTPDETNQYCQTATYMCADDAEGFQIVGHRMFVNIAKKGLVQVFDVVGDSTSPIANIPLPRPLSSNFPMCADAKHKRLFVAVRKPVTDACLLVIQMETGEMMARIPCVGDADDIFYDASRQRVYVMGGVGAVNVIDVSHRKQPSEYSVIAEIETGIGARTGLWFPDRDSLYVAVPGSVAADPRILVLEAV